MVVFSLGFSRKLCVSPDRCPTALGCSERAVRIIVVKIASWPELGRVGGRVLGQRAGRWCFAPSCSRINRSEALEQS